MKFSLRNRLRKGKGGFLGKVSSAIGNGVSKVGDMAKSAFDDAGGLEGIKDIGTHIQNQAANAFHVGDNVVRPDMGAQFTPINYEFKKDDYSDLYKIQANKKANEAAEAAKFKMPEVDMPDLKGGRPADVKAANLLWTKAYDQTAALSTDLAQYAPYSKSTREEFESVYGKGSFDNYRKKYQEFVYSSQNLKNLKTQLETALSASAGYFKENEKNISEGKSGDAYEYANYMQKNNIFGLTDENYKQLKDPSQIFNLLENANKFLVGGKVKKGLTHKEWQDIMKWDAVANANKASWLESKWSIMSEEEKTYTPIKMEENANHRVSEVAGTEEGMNHGKWSAQADARTNRGMKEVHTNIQSLDKDLQAVMAQYNMKPDEDIDIMNLGGDAKRVMDAKLNKVRSIVDAKLSSSKDSKGNPLTANTASTQQVEKAIDELQEESKGDPLLNNYLALFRETNSISFPVAGAYLNDKGEKVNEANAVLYKPISPQGTPLPDGVDDSKYYSLAEIKELSKKAGEKGLGYTFAPAKVKDGYSQYYEKENASNIEDYRIKSGKAWIKGQIFHHANPYMFNEHGQSIDLKVPNNTNVHVNNNAGGDDHKYNINASQMLNNHLSVLAANANGKELTQFNGDKVDRKTWLFDKFSNVGVGNPEMKVKDVWTVGLGNKSSIIGVPYTSDVNEMKDIIPSVLKNSSLPMFDSNGQPLASEKKSAAAELYIDKEGNPKEGVSSSYVLGLQTKSNGQWIPFVINNEDKGRFDASMAESFDSSPQGRKFAEENKGNTKYKSTPEYLKLVKDYADDILLLSSNFRRGGYLVLSKEGQNGLVVDMGNSKTSFGNYNTILHNGKYSQNKDKQYAGYSEDVNAMFKNINEQERATQSIMASNLANALRTGTAVSGGMRESDYRALSNSNTINKLSPDPLGFSAASIRTGIGVLSDLQKSSGGKPTKEQADKLYTLKEQLSNAKAKKTKDYADFMNEAKEKGIDVEAELKKYNYFIN